MSIGRELSRRLSLLASLTKLPISLLATFSAVAGYAAFARGLGAAVLSPCAGLLLLGMGGCALNEWEEREIDRRMERTRRRPLPSGAMRPASGLAIGIALAASGLAVLASGCGLAPAALGLLALVWYDGVYTPLKRVTAFAWLPGSLIGAIPPAIGWAAAGGSVLDRRLLPLALFFFLWQVPHFWLLLLDRAGEYEEAGFPSIAKVFGRGQLARLTLVWTLAAAASSLLLPIWGVVASRWTSFALAAKLHRELEQVQAAIADHRRNAVSGSKAADRA